MEVILLKGTIAERLKKEAEKLDMNLEEFLLEFFTQNLDPKDRAKEYITVAKEMLVQAKEEISEDDYRQAAEKIWGAAALTVKAYAFWKEGVRLASHRDLWEYSRVLANDLGDWVLHVWNEASGIHTCFYEGWCTREHLEATLKSVEQLVKTVEGKIV